MDEHKDENICIVCYSKRINLIKSCPSGKCKYPICASCNLRYKKQCIYKCDTSKPETFPQIEFQNGHTEAELIVGRSPNVGTIETTYTNVVNNVSLAKKLRPVMGTMYCLLCTNGRMRLFSEWNLFLIHLTNEHEEIINKT